VSELHAVIFDLDDTLYPERDYVLSGLEAVAAWAEVNLGIPREEGLAELWRLFEDGVRGHIFDGWLESRDLESNGWIRQMVQVYREHNPSIEPYSGVPELLQRLRSSYCLGLVSDGYVEVQRKKLASLKLTPLFHVLVFSDEWGEEAWKPDRRPFETVLERLGTKGLEAVYVADNPNKDFIGARQLSMWTVRIRRPEGLYSHVEPPSTEHAPDAEIETLDRLEATLLQIVSKADAN